MLNLIRDVLVDLFPIGASWTVKNLPEPGKEMSPNAAPIHIYFALRSHGRTRVLAATPKQMDDMLERPQLNKRDVPRRLRRHL